MRIELIHKPRHGRRYWRNHAYRDWPRRIHCRYPRCNSARFPSSADRELVRRPSGRYEHPGKTLRLWQRARDVAETTSRRSLIHRPGGKKLNEKYKKRKRRGKNNLPRSKSQPDKKSCNTWIFFYVIFCGISVCLQKKNNSEGEWVEEADSQHTSRCRKIMDAVLHSPSVGVLVRVWRFGISQTTKGQQDRPYPK